MARYLRGVVNQFERNLGQSLTMSLSLALIGLPIGLLSHGGSRWFPLLAGLSAAGVTIAVETLVLTTRLVIAGVALVARRRRGV